MLYVVWEHDGQRVLSNGDKYRFEIEKDLSREQVRLLAKALAVFAETPSKFQSCPVCLGPPKTKTRRVNNSIRYMVVCSNCGLRGRECFNMDQAIDSWNRIRYECPGPLTLDEELALLGYENIPEAVASIERGLADAAVGRVKKRKIKIDEDKTSE